MATHDQINTLGISPAWDLEDLVKLGKKVKACPYYSSRALMDTAQIIICPYNYLIDPLIRDNMNINLRGHILVFDEAHNMEDSAREASSASPTQEQILEARNDLENLASQGVKLESCKTLITMLTNISNWMDAYSEKLTDYSEFDRNGKIFSGSEMIETLKHLDIEPKSLREFENCLAKLREEPENDNDKIPKPTSATLQLLKQLFLMLHYLFKDGMKYANDYKVALVKSQVYGYVAKKDQDGWLRKKRSPKIVYSLHFWCLNPGVAFSELGDQARSIILTSGTLAPMSSFESELQIKFPIQLEANHVISKDQVWVGTVARGPTDQQLNATFKHAETWAFQDELGRMVVEVCEAVPRGVLCFLPSYSMLDKLVDRWRKTDIWDQIESKKIVITEPRKAEEFAEAMNQFYSAIKSTSESAENEQNGVFFMAVCRGKVSEGLDFTDCNARAVIAVGIPFPNVKDIQVDLKRQYNNIYYKSRGLLSGNQWYEIQAYRALNQALGRCIRHRFDWGALILVDDRYQQTGWHGNRYVNGLSKWIRKNLHHPPDCRTAISEIREFARKMTQSPPQQSGGIGTSASEQLKNDSSNTFNQPVPKFISPPPVASLFNRTENRKTYSQSNESHISNAISSWMNLNHTGSLSGATTTVVTNIKKGETKESKHALSLTPVKCFDDLSLTPIPGNLKCIASTQDDNVHKISTQKVNSDLASDLKFPITSTQKEQSDLHLKSGNQLGDAGDAVSIQNSDCSAIYNNGETSTLLAASTPVRAVKAWSHSAKNFHSFSTSTVLSPAGKLHAKINSSREEAKSTSNLKQPSDSAQSVSTQLTFNSTLSSVNRISESCIANNDTSSCDDNLGNSNSCWQEESKDSSSYSTRNQSSCHSDDDMFADDFSSAEKSKTFFSNSLVKGSAASKRKLSKIKNKDEKKSQPTVSNYFSPTVAAVSILKPSKAAKKENKKFVSKSNYRMSDPVPEKEFNCFSIASDASDMDDFVKDSCSTQVKRKVSKARRSLIKQKGVVFTDFDE